MKLSYSLLAAACASLLSPCLATSPPQHPLYPTTKLKWKGCGEVNNHTVECM
jgi:hypothetical protein